MPVPESSPDADSSGDPETVPPDETAASGSETGVAYSLSGMNFVLPDYASISEEDEDTDNPSVLIELEPGMRRAMFMSNNLGSFSDESNDLLNQLMVASFYDGMNVVSQDDYTVSVAGETAQTSVCIVDDDGSQQLWTVLAFIHDGTQYVCAYVEVMSSEGDSTDFFDLLKTITFDA